MRWATRNETRVEATPNERAICPACKGDVHSKCGGIVTWHWAHRVGDDCDRWYEPESEWHLRWKKCFPDTWQEVVIGEHRADVKTPKFILELQASTISEEEIFEREKFYGEMRWLLKGDEFHENIEMRLRDGYLSFRWKNPRKSWWAAHKSIFIDFPNFGLFRVGKIYPELPCGGWGVDVDAKAFFVECGLDEQKSQQLAADYNRALGTARESDCLPRIVVPPPADDNFCVR